MSDYSNPFGAFDTSALQGTASGPGFVSQANVMEQSEKNQMARPFIDMARRSQELDLGRKQLEHDEFGSPEAKLMRAKEIQLKSQKAQADIERVNPELARDIQKAKDDLRLSPFETDSKIAKAQEIVETWKGKPIRDFMAAAADFSHIYSDPSNKNTTAFEKAKQYQDWLKAYTEGHPNVQVPPNFMNWSEDLEKHLTGARLITLMSVGHEQKMAEEKLKTDAQIKGHQISAGATVQAARETATARSADVKATLEGKESTAEQKALDHVQTSVDKARANLWQVGLGLPPKEKASAQKEYLDGVRDDAMKNYESIMGGKSASGDKVDQLKSQVEASGYVFEPDKYEYGINPATGKLARRPKGK